MKNAVAKTSKRRRWKKPPRPPKPAPALRPKAKGQAKTQIVQRREKFTQEVALVAPACGMDEREAKRFADYWTESNPGGHKMRFEMQRVFDLRRRMAYWMERSRRMHPDTAVGRARPLDATDLPATDDLLDG